MGIPKPAANPEDLHTDSLFGAVAPELANNLEWLLASGQAKDEQVAQGLVEAYYPPIYQVVLAVLNEASAARRVAQEIIAAALINAYRYSSDQPVSSWLASLAIPIILGEQQRRDRPRSRSFQEIFTASIGNTVRYSSFQQVTQWLAGMGIPALGGEKQRVEEPVGSSSIDKGATIQAPAAFGQFPQEIRLVAALHTLLDLPAIEIARVLNKEEREVENQLQFARSQLMITQWGSARPAGNSPETADKALYRAIQAAWPSPQLTEREHNQVVQKSVRAAERQRRGAQRSNALKEILAVGVTFVLVGLLVWRTEILKPEQKPTPTAAPPAAVAAQKKPTVKPATSTPRVQTYKVPSPVWPTIPPEPTSTPFPMEAIYHVRAGDTLEIIAESLRISAEELASYNRILPEQPLEQYQVLVIPGRIRSQAILGAFPTSPAPTKAPLTTRSTIQEVVEQPLGLFQFYQNQGYSLWMDQVIHIHGGEAFQGPEQAYRFQVWMGNGGLIMASGRDDSIPAEVLMIIVNPDGSGGMYISRPQRAMQRGEPAWFMDIDHMPEEFAYLATGYLMLYLDSLPIIFGQKPEWLNGAGKTIITGSQIMLGRQALVMEQRGIDAKLLRRVWIDAQTGLMLRKQVFGNGGQTLKWEIETSSIFLNFSLNPNLFNPHMPWRGSYAANADGDPTLFDVQAVMAATPSLARPQPRPAPPEGFKAARKALTLRSETAFDIFDPEMIQSGMPVDLYAGGVYLSSMTIGEPNMTICARSPDGNTLAMQSITIPFDSEAGNTPTLKLVDLRDAGSPDIRDTGFRAQDLAFSPDSRMLAISGRREFGAGVYIWDLTDESSKLLTGIGNANSARALTWSPDGQYLALIHDTYAEGVGEVLVLQIAPPTGKRVFQGSLTSMEKDADGNYTMKLVVDTLPEPWEIHFRDNALDLDSCLRAPEQ